MKPTTSQAKAASETLAAFFADLGEIHKTTVTTTDVTMSEMPDEIRLPLDTPTALADFYGAPIAPGTRQEGRLKWFNFPREVEPVLFSRNGFPLTDHDGDGEPDHRCHERVADSLESALAELHEVIGVDEFRLQGLHVFGGCWAYRRKTGGRTWSTHAWGAAVDLNPPENGWKRRTTTFSSEAFDIMEKYGWLSGYRAWGHDAMHFQMAVPAHIVAGSYYAEKGLPKHITKA